MKTYSGEITGLKTNEVFVFGSNLRGQHGKGAAHLAMKKFGARWGVGEGLTGRTYALPTKRTAWDKMGIRDVEEHIFRFAEEAGLHSGLSFLLTDIGCGLAGHSYEDIAEILVRAKLPDNVVVSERMAIEMNKITNYGDKARVGGNI